LVVGFLRETLKFFNMANIVSVKDGYGNSAEFKINEDAHISKWTKVFSRMLLFMQFHQDVINKALPEVSGYPNDLYGADKEIYKNYKKFSDNEPNY